MTSWVMCESVRLWQNLILDKKFKFIIQFCVCFTTSNVTNMQTKFELNFFHRGFKKKKSQKVSLGDIFHHG